MNLARDPALTAFAEGLDALRHEQFEEAVERLELAETLGSAGANAPAYLSSAYLASGHPLEAQAAIDRAVALDPDGFAPRLKAGELALRLGNLTAAENAFVAALRVTQPGTPDMAAARRWLAITREQRRGSVERQVSLPRTTWLNRLAGFGRRPAIRKEEEPA